MRFKKLSNNFWKLEANGHVFVGTWATVNKEAQKMVTIICR